MPFKNAKITCQRGAEADAAGADCEVAVEALRALQKEEIARWWPVLKEAGINAE